MITIIYFAQALFMTSITHLHKPATIHVHYLVSITCYLGVLGGERWLHASPMATPLRSRPPPCLSGGRRRQEGTARPIGHLGISRQAIPRVTKGTESCCLPEYASIWRQSHPKVGEKAGQGSRTGYLAAGQGSPDRCDRGPVRPDRVADRGAVRSLSAATGGCPGFLAPLSDPTQNGFPTPKTVPPPYLAHGKHPPAQRMEFWAMVVNSKNLATGGG